MMPDRKPFLTIVTPGMASLGQRQEESPPASPAASTRRAVLHDIERRLRDDRPDLYRSLVDGARFVHKQSLVERIGDALGSQFGLGVYCGIYIGSFVTLGLAWVWSLAL